MKGACKGMPWAGLEDGVVSEGYTRGRPIYRAARGAEQGRDLRWEVFENALTDSRGVEIVKEGIASWIVGLRQRAGWARQELPRTLQAQDGGKRWGTSSTTWAYQTPIEVLSGGVPRDMDRAPWDEPETRDLFG
jgi:hypothetical protein